MLLRFVHSLVSFIHQIFSVAPVAGIGAHANTDVNVEAFIVDNVRGGQDPKDFSRTKSRVFFMFDLRQENYEFVATHATYGVRSPDTRNQAAGDRLQQLVAHNVAQRVIDFFEVVQIDEQDRELFALPLSQ